MGGGIAGVVLDWPCRPLRCLVWTRLKRLARVAPESLASVLDLVGTSNWHVRGPAIGTWCMCFGLNKVRFVVKQVHCVAVLDRSRDWRGRSTFERGLARKARILT